MKLSFWGTVAISAALLMTPLRIAHSEDPSPAVNLDELGMQSDENWGFKPENLRISDDPMGNYRAVIGEDDRIPVLSRMYPFSTIGRLDWILPNGSLRSWCTGTLIGPDLVLTNSHCLTKPGTNEVITPGEYQRGGDRLIFKANLIQGEARAEAEVIDYQYGWDDDALTGDDWALLRINQPLGEQFGYLHWLNLDLTDGAVRMALAGKLFVAGYAGDFPKEDNPEFGTPGTTAGLSPECTIIDASNEGAMAGLLFHQCDTNPGASGSAIFVPLIDRDGERSYGIVGLHSSSGKLNEEMTLPTGETTALINIGVQVNRWSATASAMLAND